MNFSMYFFLYIISVVMIYLTAVRSSLLYDGSRRPEWIKRQSSILSESSRRVESEPEPYSHENEVQDTRQHLERNGKGFKDGGSGSDQSYGLIEECCPTHQQWIAPRGGVSRDGKILELFRNENVSQSFFQVSCRPDRKNRPCGFVSENPVFGGYSRCIQQYTYQYAIVRDFDADADDQYRVDHIRMRSGCTCLVSKQFGNYDLGQVSLANRKPGHRYKPIGKGNRTPDAVGSSSSGSAGMIRERKRKMTNEGVEEDPQNIASNLLPPPSVWKQYQHEAYGSGSKRPPSYAKLKTAAK